MFETPTNPNERDERDCRRANGPESALQAHGPHEWRIRVGGSIPKYNHYWCKGLRAHPNVMIGKGA